MRCSRPGAAGVCTPTALPLHSLPPHLQHLHNLSHGRPDLCMEAHGGRIYPCIVEDLEQPERARYGPSVAAWLRHFPAAQVHLMQYESVIARATMAGDLAGLKGFLGMDAELPSKTLPLSE